MNLLLIGGTGVLSTAITNEALKNGYEVTMVNRGNRLERIPNGVKLIKSDFRDYSYIDSQIFGHFYDAIIDFLCFSEQNIMESVDLYSKYTNQYFFISTAAVIDTRVGGLLNEESPKPLPIWDYSINKWRAEQCLVKIAVEKKLNYTIIRPCVTYDYTRIPYGIAPIYGYHWTLIARAQNGKPIIRWNGGVNRCNMMRVEDFAVGIVGLIGNNKAYNQAFNICGDEAPSFNDVLSCISYFIGHDVKVVDISGDFYAKELASRKGEILGGRSIDAIHSNKKLKGVVPGFKQTIFLKDGVKKTIQLYIDLNYQKGIDWTFDGDTDRIIKKWCLAHGQDYKCFNLGFVDYFGNAKRKERYTYWVAFNKDKLYVKILIFFCDIIRKLSHVPTKLLRRFRQISGCK